MDESLNYRGFSIRGDSEQASGLFFVLTPDDAHVYTGGSVEDAKAWIDRKLDAQEVPQ